MSLLDEQGIDLGSQVLVEGSSRVVCGRRGDLDRSGRVLARHGEVVGDRASVAAAVVEESRTDTSREPGSGFARRGRLTAAGDVWDSGWRTVNPSAGSSAQSLRRRSAAGSRLLGGLHEARSKGGEKEACRHGRRKHAGRVVLVLLVLVVPSRCCAVLRKAEGRFEHWGTRLKTECNAGRFRFGHSQPSSEQRAGPQGLIARPTRQGVRAPPHGACPAR